MYKVKSTIWLNLKSLIFFSCMLISSINVSAQICGSCFNPAYSFPAGGMLSTSGLPDPMPSGICVYINGTFIVDQLWVLNDVCFSMDVGAEIVVESGGTLIMTGGTISNYTGATHDGIVVNAGSVAALTNVKIWYTNTAITGNQGSVISFNGIIPMGSQTSPAFIQDASTGIRCVGCRLEFDQAGMVGVGDGFNCYNPQSVSITRSDIRTSNTGVSVQGFPGSGPVNISENTNFTVAANGITGGIVVVGGAGPVIRDNTMMQFNNVGDGIAQQSPFLVGGGSEFPPNPIPATWFTQGGCLSGGGNTGERYSGNDDQILKVDESEISITPNPANEKIRISVPNSNSPYNIELRDLAGKLVLVQTVEKGQREAILDLTATYPGLFMLTVFSDNFHHTEKVVIAK